MSFAVVRIRCCVFKTAILTNCRIKHELWFRFSLVFFFCCLLVCSLFGVKQFLIFNYSIDIYFVVKSRKICLKIALSGLFSVLSIIYCMYRKLADSFVNNLWKKCQTLNTTEYDHDRMYDVYSYTNMVTRESQVIESVDKDRAIETSEPNITADLHRCYAMQRQWRTRSHSLRKWVFSLFWRNRFSFDLIIMYAWICDVN